MTTARMAVALTVLSIATTVASAWAVLFFIGGNWSLSRFTLWCMAMAPVSAALHHVFRVGENVGTQLYRWRQFKAAMVGLMVASVSSFLVADPFQPMALVAYAGTTLAYGLSEAVTIGPVRSPPNKSLDRTREG